MRQNKSNNQSGNVFMFVLLALALFAALAFAVSRGMRSQTTTVLSERDLELAVTEILGQAQKLSRAVDRVRRNGVSETDFCFQHDEFSNTNDANYANEVECANNKHRIFHPDGGGIGYQHVSENWLDSSHSGDQGYGEWMFTQGSSVIGIGAGALNQAGENEVLAHINHLKPEVCTALNEKLGITGIPDNTNFFGVTAPYRGVAFSSTGQIAAAALDGQRSGCFNNTTVWQSYVFYHVLLERSL